MSDQGWAMFDPAVDFPFAVMLDTLTTYVSRRGEDRQDVRARIERVVAEQVKRRDEQARRLRLIDAGVGP